MTERKIKQLIAQELAAPTLGMMEQFLAVHRVVYEAGQPVIRRIAETEKGLVTAYLAVERHRFYLAVYLDARAAKITWVQTADFHDIWLRAASEELTSTQMLALTSLASTRRYDKGDSSWSAARHDHSALDFQPDPEPDTFENHLCKLLDWLEQDADGIRALAAHTECMIRVASYFHNGNGMLGGHFVDAPTLKRISNLDLAIDFDLYIEGNKWQ